MTRLFGSTLRQIPNGIWVLGLVSMLMDISSEMVHSLLPLLWSRHLEPAPLQ